MGVTVGGTAQQYPWAMYFARSHSTDEAKSLLPGAQPVPPGTPSKVRPSQVFPPSAE
jgi:hypothetical protein